MKKYTQLKFSFLFAIFSIFMFGISCNSETKQSDVNVQGIEEVDSLNSNKSIMQYMHNQSLVYTKYKLPLPVDLYQYLREKEPAFDASVLNPRETYDRFKRKVDMAINLGFYSADLAYCSILENKEEAVEYFKVTQILAANLKIDIGYSETMVERFHANLSEADSLYSISNDIYWKTCNYLEENEDVNVLPFIIVGSWLESVYLTINAFPSSGENPDIVKMVEMQAPAIDNLIEYLYRTMLDMKVFAVNSDIQRVSNMLKDIRKSYDKLEEGGMTSILFDEIIQKYRSYREQYLFEEY
ncbi:MAG: hypothetical protein KAI79_06475 [Bacteroidales bacterium]|nr:hypothetical protein [Bacteroidales bacterium]